MHQDLHVLIMAGGSGSRFWPRSRHSQPKQFLRLTSAATLLEATIERVRGLCPPENVWVLTRRDLLEQTRRLLPELPPERLVGEPEGRDTAPCLVHAAVHVARVAADPLLLILPSDHIIPEVREFRATVEDAILALVKHGGLMTFGIRPTFPATGYGYIQRGEEEAESPGAQRCFRVRSFREKPDSATAHKYLLHGGYLWNAGIFLWRLGAFRDALEHHAPALAEGWRRLAEMGPRLADTGSKETIESFRSLPRLSIDYALLERAQSLRVMEAGFTWDDVGSWKALEKYNDSDGAGNLIEGRVLLVDSASNTVLSHDGKVIAAIGLNGWVIVDTPDALLICPKERCEEVKKLVEGVRKQGWTEVL